MAIKYRATWNTSENEALIQFDFVEDRGSSGTAQVIMPRSVMSLAEEKQSEEAFKRFIEIHGSDFVTDERIKEQNAIAETTSKALLELSMVFFSLQSELKGLERQIEELKQANIDLANKDVDVSVDSPFLDDFISALENYEEDLTGANADVYANLYEDLVEGGDDK